MPIKINLIAPPRYVMTTTTLERTEGLSVLNQAMAVIKEKIEEKRGVFNVQMEFTMFSVLGFFFSLRWLLTQMRLNLQGSWKDWRGKMLKWMGMMMLRKWKPKLKIKSPERFRRETIQKIKDPIANAFGYNASSIENFKCKYLKCFYCFKKTNMCKALLNNI
nr:PREDICTED: uncharacterized protein LOC104050421 isoform X1 [Phalacrocorax carbo]